MSSVAEKTLGEASVGEARAFAHPCRREILKMIGVEGVLSPVAFTARVDGWSLGTVAYHFRVLARLGVIQEASTRQRRGAVEHIYELAGMSES